MYGFERIAPTTMEEMQTTSAALATLAEKENELSISSQVRFLLSHVNCMLLQIRFFRISF